MRAPMKPGGGQPDEALVRSYFAAWSHGQTIDALNAFATDARLRDEAGRERRGIREIAAAFARNERPVKAEIEELRREGDTVTVQVRMTFRAGDTSRLYRSVFQVSRDRIRSLVIDRVPAARVQRRPAIGPA